MNSVHRLTGKPKQMWQSGKVIREECNLGGFNGYVSSRQIYADAHMSGSPGKPDVDTISNESDGAAFFLKASYDLAFLMWIRRCEQILLTPSFLFQTNVSVLTGFA